MLSNRQKNAQDKRIERAYYRRCSGVTINVLDIGKVFAAGREAIAQNPSISDDALGDAVAEFVKTIACAA